MKLKKKNKQSNFIGGTIAVPPDYDPLNNSCRSDITMGMGTQDLNSDDVSPQTSSSSRLLHQEYAYMRQNAYESNDSTNQLAPSQLYSMQSDSTFHTAAAVANNNTPQQSEKGRLEIREEADLDRIAEDAAISCFGADADKVVMDDVGSDEKGMPRNRSRSSLVAENSSIDGEIMVLVNVWCVMIGMMFQLTFLLQFDVYTVSWFAARGLMSRRSFERYQEE